LLRGRNGLCTLALAGGVTLHAVNLYIATTILPSVVRDIGGLPYYAWNTTAFEISSILGSAFSTSLLHRAGPRGAYAVAAFLFGLGTLACALAPTMPVMVGARAIQGFGGGVLFALSFAMIRLVFAESLWTRAMAAISGMWGVAVLIGPAVGGAFASHGAWRGAFFTLLPAIALSTALAVGVLPRRDRDAAEPPGLPLVQLALLAAALVCISAGSVTPDPIGKSVWIIASVGLATVLIRWEPRARHRLLPRGAFVGTLGALYATISLTAVTVTVTEIFIPLFLQVLHGQPPLVAGYLAALMAAGWTIASLVSANATGRGAGRTIVAMPILTLAGMAVLFVLVPSESEGRWLILAPICLALFTVGFGVGLGWPHLMTRVLQVADWDEQDIAAASLTTVQLIVSALGAAVSGMVANLAGLLDPGGEIGTAHAAIWLFGLFAIPPFLAVFTAIRCTRSGFDT
jgi:MFS family permease